MSQGLVALFFNIASLSLVRYFLVNDKLNLQLSFASIIGYITKYTSKMSEISPSQKSHQNAGRMQAGETQFISQCCDLERMMFLVIDLEFSS